MWPDSASPASVLTSIGKKVITTTTAAFECQSKPNHITMIGAMPTNGTVLASAATGNRPRCRNELRSISTPVAKPSAQPITRPISTECNTVCSKSDTSTPKLANSEWATRVGAGKSTCGMSNTWISNCQNTSTQAPNNRGVPKRPNGLRSSSEASHLTLKTATTSSSARPTKSHVSLIVALPA